MREFEIQTIKQPWKFTEFNFQTNFVHTNLYLFVFRLDFYVYHYVQFDHAAMTYLNFSLWKHHQH